MNQYWLEGIHAFYALKDKVENPYPFGTPQHYEWNNGWDDACIIANPTNPSIGVEYV